MELIDVDTLLDLHRSPLIDVRSPGEFRHGHIPGAVNLPLFDDSERAEIGTLYKQSGRKQAVELGLEIAGDKAQRLIDSVKSIASESAFVVHCWRGGMRSEGFAWLCRDCGLQPRVLAGGYRSFRRAAHHCFAQPRELVVLAGHTGAGKTHLLGQLREQGQQVVDLEELANHRGSAFGGIDQPPQPTVEQFENRLFLRWRSLDPCVPVWIEGESRAIGKIQIPHGVWDQMSAAPTIFLEVGRDQRVDFLVEQYGDLPADQLSLAMQKISKRLGGARLQFALDALQRGDVKAVAATVLHYYDKAYDQGLLKRPVDNLVKLPISGPTQAGTTARLIELAAELTAQCDNRKPTADPPNLSRPDPQAATDFSFRI